MNIEWGTLWLGVTTLQIKNMFIWRTHRRKLVGICWYTGYSPGKLVFFLIYPRSHDPLYHGVLTLDASLLILNHHDSMRGIRGAHWSHWFGHVWTMASKRRLTHQPNPTQLFNNCHVLVGGLVAINFICAFILGWISSSQLTFIFFRGVALAHQPEDISCVIILLDNGMM